MRILYLDLDTLRPDHLGCYGYRRDTSPNIDRVAAQGIRFENFYASDVPCLPSRAALFTGQFGIHTGVVGHGGTAADPFIEGTNRGFRNAAYSSAWVTMLRNSGLWTVSISPFAERHGAWFFYTGFQEMINTGKRGLERADEIQPHALDWLKRNAKRDNWFLQLNYWDPHTPYDVPVEYGNPFENDPPPDWLTEEMIQEHRTRPGAHSAHEPWDWEERTNPKWPRVPTTIASRADFRRWIDGYDVGIRYMDDHIGQVLNLLADEGVLDDTMIIISSDHGENQGELNVYGDHHTADYVTPCIPLIISHQGHLSGTVDRALHYNLDLPPTMAELLGQDIPPVWDGRSFAPTIRDGTPCGRDCLVLSQCAWTCQRGVRFGPWMMVRTYHAGYRDYPPKMLFNIEQDPHETCDLTAKHPEVIHQAEDILEQWQAEMMDRSEQAVDPLWTVMREGGPFHVRGALKRYCERLRATGRSHHADRLEAQYSKG